MRPSCLGVRSALIVAAAVNLGGAAPRRRTGRIARAVRPRHRRDARGSGAGRLADLAPHAGRLGLQPARPDPHRQRRRAAPRLDPRTGRGQPARDAAGLRRRAVHAEPERRHPGHRRGDRRPPVGVPPRAAGRHQRLRQRGVDQPETSRSTGTASSTPAPTTTSTRSTPRPGGWRGRRRSSTTWSTPPGTRPVRSSPAARRSRARSCRPHGGPEACVITAHDAETGAEVWRRRLVPAPGEPGRRDLGRRALRGAGARRVVDGAELRPRAEPGVRRDVGHVPPRPSSSSAASGTATSTTTRRWPSTATPARSCGITST